MRVAVIPTREASNMLQLTIESSFFYFALLFFFFGLFAFGWLVIHVEHSRHFSKFKVAASLILGSLFMGFGLHFLLLVFGA
jgi:TRAP-type C4-dicarboxylate transport system permease small subunit